MGSDSILRQEEERGASFFMEPMPAESPQENSARPRQDDDDDDRQPITIRPKFHNLRDLHNYWHNHPIFDGKALADWEKTAKRTWKKKIKITTAEETLLSKMGRIMNAVDEYAEKEATTSEDVVEQWYPCTQKGFSLPKTLKWLDQNGFRTKQASRGINKKK